MARNLPALTGIRGIAAVYVVMFHFAVNIGVSAPIRMFVSHGYLAVDLFFILSGFVMALNYATLFTEGWNVLSLRKFLFRRVGRVYPLYFITMVATAALIAKGIISPPAHLKFWRDLGFNLLMLQTWIPSTSLLSSSWSISAEWAAYLVFPLCLWLGYHSASRMNKVVVSVCCLACLAALSVVPRVLTDSPHTWTLLDITGFAHHTPWPVLRCLPEFILGIVSAKCFADGDLAVFQRAPVLGTFIAVAILGLLFTKHCDLTVVALFSLLICDLAVSNSWPSRLARSRVAVHLGVLSYSVYLLHVLFQPLVNTIHGAMNHHHLHHGRTMASVIVAVLVYACSFLAYHVIEEPGREFVKSLPSARLTRFRRSRNVPSSAVTGA